MLFNSIFIGIIVIIVILGVYSFIFSKKVRKEGIETTAVVSRITEDESVTLDEEEAGGMITHTFYVSYKNQMGEQIEATLSNPKNDLEVGSRIKIRYLPGREEYPVMTEVVHKTEA